MPNNEPVTQRQFYTEMGEIKDDLGEIKVIANQVSTNTKEIDILRKEQRGLAALSTSIGGAIGAAVAVTLKILNGE